MGTVPRMNRGGLSPSRTAVVLLMTATLAAGQPPKARPPVFRGGTELVLVNVVARDKSGAFVRGLTKDDFVVLEDGKPQTIERAEFEQLDRAPAQRAPAFSAPQGRPSAASRALPTAKAPATLATPKAAAARRGADLRDRRLVVLFFDLSSMQPEELTRVVAAARTYTGQLTPSDLVAVVSLSTTWRVLQDFTADREQLDRVIGKLDPNGGLGFEEGTTGDADGTRRQRRGVHARRDGSEHLQHGPAARSVARAGRRAGRHRRAQVGRVFQQRHEPDGPGEPRPDPRRHRPRGARERRDLRGRRARTAGDGAGR